MFAALSYASLSLADPTGSSPIVAAVRWLEGTLLGTIATTVAVIAVASVGMMMLTGRVNVRHGLTIVAGCFVLFGASSIAAGLRYAADTGFGGGAVAEAPPPPPPPLPSATRAPVKAVDDPYAGASVIRSQMHP